jgi:hypothetical protein
LYFYCLLHWQQWLLYFKACRVANLQTKEGIFFPFLSSMAETDVPCRSIIL